YRGRSRRAGSRRRPAARRWSNRRALTRAPMAVYGLRHRYRSLPALQQGLTAKRGPRWRPRRARRLSGFDRLLRVLRQPLDPALDFAPAHRRGNGSVRCGTDGVDGGQRASPRVLVVVDEDATRGAVGDPVLGGDEVRPQLLEPLGQGLGEGPDLLLRGPAL